jgi:hypothetical protein
VSNETAGAGAPGDDSIASTIIGDYGTLLDPGADPIRMEWTVGGRLRLIRLLPQPVTVFDVPVRQVQSITGSGAYVRITVAGTEYPLSFHAAIKTNILLPNPVGFATFDQARAIVESGWLQWADAFRAAGVPSSYSPGIAAIGSPSIIRGVRIAGFALIGVVALIVIAFVVSRAVFGTGG